MEDEDRAKLALRGGSLSSFFDLDLVCGFDLVVTAGDELPVEEAMTGGYVLIPLGHGIPESRIGKALNITLRSQRENPTLMYSVGKQVITLHYSPIMSFRA